MAIEALSRNHLQIVHTELQKSTPNIVQITQAGRWSYLINHFCYGHHKPWIELVQKINRSFAELEQKGSKFYNFNQEGIEKKWERYYSKRKMYLEIADLIGLRINALQGNCPELKQAYHELKCRAIGLRYRLTKINGGINPLEKPDLEWLAKIKELAKTWKSQQPFDSQEDLDELQNKQLEALACYPEWLSVVVENPSYLKEVFNWSLHNYQRVGVIVKNYEMRRIIKAALLPANLGFALNAASLEDEVLNYKMVETKTPGVLREILTVPIYHGSFKEFQPSLQERINILNPKEEIHFKQGNYHLTVEEFFKELGKKNLSEANISLCGEWGFANFHPVKGVWDADDKQYKLSQSLDSKWVDHVPPARIASHAELVEQYGEEMENRTFFFKVMATRQYKDLTGLDCHSFLQLFVKMGDGNWKVMSIGLYAYRFQQGLLDGLWLFGATVARVVCLLDQNTYFTHRQRGALPIFSPEKSKEEILQYMRRALYSKSVFQFAGRNCSMPIQQIVEDLKAKQMIEIDISNIYKVPLTLSKSRIMPLDALLSWAHRQWEWVRWTVVTMVHTILLSHRSMRIDKKRYSLREFYQKYGHVTYNPSYLPAQIEAAHQSKQGGFVKGELYFSHTSEKKYQYEVRSKV